MTKLQLTKAQLALIAIIPLGLIVLLTAANRYWGWETDSLRIPAGIMSSGLLVVYFSKKTRAE